MAEQVLSVVSGMPNRSGGLGRQKRELATDETQTNTDKEEALDGNGSLEAKCPARANSVPNVHCRGKAGLGH